MKYQVEFHFGIREISKWKIYATALFLNLAVVLIVRTLKTTPEQLWRLIDDFGREFDVRLINELFLQVPELLDSRIEADVTDAIEEYKNVVEWEEPEINPVFTEVEDGETLLGGEMRYRAPWIKDTKGI